MTTENSFFEFAAILGLAAGVGLLARVIRQPLIVALLATGILAGPSGLRLIRSSESLELLAHIGISLLLFIVGLRLDTKLVKTIGPVALATGIGQLLFTSVLGFLIVIAAGMSTLAAVYVAVALTFSSTIIIVKLLSDKKEIDSLHGQIAIGFLLVQDFAAMIALIGLGASGAAAAQEGGQAYALAMMAAKGGALFGGVWLVARFIFPILLRPIAASQELLSLSAVAWAVLLSAASELLGLSKEVGAFVAGISLASSQYRDAIGARLTTLRDFLLLFFFVALGAGLEWSAVGAQWGLALGLSLFVLIGNPLVVMAIMGWMGYRKRTGFMAGLTVAQISEFSLILAALGVSLGHLSDQIMGLITLVGVITICASTYMILYSGLLYQRLAPLLKLFERKDPFRETAMDTLMPTGKTDIILVGLGNYGSGLAEYLLRRGWALLAVDFDPTVLEKWRERGVPVHYGDMGDPELVEQLPLDKALWIVSTVRSQDFSLGLLSELHRRGYQGKIAVAATNDEEAKLFQQGGATLVFRPFADAAEQAADALTHAMALLPTTRNWPVAFKEVRLQTGTLTAGLALRELALRSYTQASVLAVSRGGQIFFDPSPDFRLLPGDRVVLLGEAEELRKAESLINQPYAAESHETVDRFDMVEVGLGESSELIGRTLAELTFRQRHKVTVVGIRRGATELTAPSPTERLQAGDRLVVLGSLNAIERLQELEPL